MQPQATPVLQPAWSLHEQRVQPRVPYQRELKGAQVLGPSLRAQLQMKQAYAACSASPYRGLRLSWACKLALLDWLTADRDPSRLTLDT